MLKAGKETATQEVAGDGSSVSPSTNADPQIPKVPSLSLPKGGGAIKGIGEKFTANPVTGTISFSVPIFTSPGRATFAPQLSLTYDSGAGNGPFGFGWNLSPPSITRKTEKGLPRYDDADDSDTFILSGTEDLIPLLIEDRGHWERHSSDSPPDEPGYVVARYRPRSEGTFARIERWTSKTSPAVHWRSITKDNVTTIYGKREDARLADPSNSSRCFSWLICESYDDKGNAIVYEYKPEDASGVDLALPQEKSRLKSVGFANRYLKRIKYGNQRPRRAGEDLSLRTDWLFEAVFDYGEHDLLIPRSTGLERWPVRADPFSSYRASFEIRTYRLCRRVLMFHHFSSELGHPDVLVRSTDFTYDEKPEASFMTSVGQSGYVRRPSGSYLKQPLPPLEFTYSEAVQDDTVRAVDSESINNLPSGLDGSRYQWIDLDSEGMPGILTEQAHAWFYKRNLSPMTARHDDGAERTVARFAPVELVALKPSLSNLSGGRQQFQDLEGNGQLDLVQYDEPTPGFFERTDDGGWKQFVTFDLMPKLAWNDPNLKFIDLTGDGRPDILISEDDVFTWYPSLGEQGFGSPAVISKPPDVERGPALVFADPTQSVYLADLSGDGLTDIVRIRNGEVCYWPNLGYGRFGAKVAMNNAPWFESPDLFDHRRIKLADLDGTGPTDIVYLGAEGVRLYFNQSGNSWSAPQIIKTLPQTADPANVRVVDLLGNGLACLVWSSPLPADASRPMRYIDLMGGQKPHLLVSLKNNLGAETRVRYAASTKFYAQDKANGKPWITKLPFPVHVVERIETYDHISRNRFVTRYAYHHGYFDGAEREFRGFGMVEQWDTEEFAAFDADGSFPSGSNSNEASHVPAVYTRTWFHTGAYLRGAAISRQFKNENYREPGLTHAQHEEQFLPDTILPGNLPASEEREACRSLKGSILRQEIYAEDGTAESSRPYLVSERNYRIVPVQPRGGNRHAVFFTHPHQTIEYHYERHPGDARVSHALTLEVDRFGNVLKSAAISYGRHEANPSLSAREQDKQSQLQITYSESGFSNNIDDTRGYRTPLPSEVRTYEIKGLSLNTGHTRFSFEEVLSAVTAAADLSYEEMPDGTLQKRLIEHARTLYRQDDLSAPLPPGQIGALALPYESYKLAFTPGLLTRVFGDGRILETMLTNEAGYVHSRRDSNWWIPSGLTFYSPDDRHSTSEELAFAEQHFFLPHRFRDPLGNTTKVIYDNYDLLPAQTIDPLANTVRAQNDYRVMQPRLITDPNGNRSEVTFDALGMIVGMAVMGKETERRGDSLANFESDLDSATIAAHLQRPMTNPHELITRATTRVVYDLFQYQRTSAIAAPQPNVVYTLVRETHDSDLGPRESTRIQHSLLYSDGFGREIQKKVQAEPGALIEGGPLVPTRWIGSGWTIFNNKGKPVKKYAPFFSATHEFEFNRRQGVSSTIFYDPLARVVATLHPNHTYEKVVFDPWQQQTWDVNDTVLETDPGRDADVGGFFRRLPDAEYLPTWHAQRIDGGLGDDERAAAVKASAHTATPAIAHLDTLGRVFLTIADNGAAGEFKTNVELDIEGNQRVVVDAQGRTVVRYDYDMLGNRASQTSMDAGTRWTLKNIAGKPIYGWDSLDRRIQYEYDELQRPTRLSVREGTRTERLAQRIVYGESQADPAVLNLRAKVFQHYDGAGVITNERYDFKGNPVSSRRSLLQNYWDEADWRLAPALEGGDFNTSTVYDALNRPITLTTPDASVVRPRYNEANLLESVEAQLRGATRSDGEPIWTAFVTNVDYDAKGQRRLIECGNGVSTEYGYDALTFRLIKLRTTRGASFPSDKRKAQDLSYTYDPAGNITTIREDAQQTIYFNNEMIAAVNQYSYDALYRLIDAGGREHIGQLSQPQPTWNDVPRMNQPQPTDVNAMRSYTEQYEYDEVGNILRTIHRARDGNWTRAYEYREPSLLEPGRSNNRLSTTTVGSFTERYAYDAHGNTTSMLPMADVDWNFKDQLRMVNLEGGGRAFYVYDASGQRVRKVWEKSASLVEERIYLGGFEVFRRRNARLGAITLERKTLSIMDDKRRIALVEARTAGSDGSPAQLIRYQFGNHLGSASLELDHTGNVISYEEYYPYGSTSFHAVSSDIEVPRKRYRHTGKERDEETGLNYHGARYYAPWLARWVNADPIGLISGINLYAYVQNNPVQFIDPDGTQERIPGENIYQRGSNYFHPAPAAPLLRERAGLQVPGMLRYSIQPLRQGDLLTMRTVLAPPNIARMASTISVHGGSVGADVVTEFNVPRGLLLGTGSTDMSVYVRRELQGRRLSGAIRGEHFQQFRQVTGRLPSRFALSVTNTQTVQRLRQGLPFSQTPVGRMTQVASSSVGLSMSGIRTTVGQTTARATGLFVRVPTNLQLFRAWSAATAQSVVNSPAARLTVAGAATALTYGRAALTIAARSLPGAEQALQAVNIARGVGVANATRLGVAYGAQVALEVGAVSAAAFAIYWAVEDTRRALNNQPTMTDEAVQTWGHYGFVGTLRQFGRELRDAPSVLGF